MKSAGIDKRQSIPKLIVWDDFAFFFNRFLKQFAVCAIPISAGTGIAWLFFPHGAVPWISAGMTIGIVPSLLSALPTEIRYCDHHYVLLDNMREWLRRGRYIKSETQLPGKWERWYLAYPKWERWMPAMDVYVQSDGMVVRVRGPRTVIRQIAKRLRYHTAIRSNV